MDYKIDQRLQVMIVTSHPVLTFIKQTLVRVQKTERISPTTTPAVHMRKNDIRMTTKEQRSLIMLMMIQSCSVAVISLSIIWQKLSLM